MTVAKFSKAEKLTKSMPLTCRHHAMAAAFDQADPWVAMLSLQLEIQTLHA